jgi:hypothetical protein
MHDYETLIRQFHSTFAVYIHERGVGACGVLTGRGKQRARTLALISLTRITSKS